MSYYAIEVIGYGKRRGYAIKHISNAGIKFVAPHVDPVDGKRYKTMEAAENAAAALGINIQKTGDFYQIISA